MNMIDARRRSPGPRFPRPENRGRDWSVGQVLACLNAAFLVIDEDFRILDGNFRAFDTLDCSRDETNFGRYIQGGTPSRTAELRRRIRAAISEPGRAMVALNHPQHDLLVCVVKGLGSSGGSGARGLVALTSPNARAPDIRIYLRELYGLSPAEADVAVCASTGADIPQIMLDRNVSIHTLRAQIASIKAKMGLTRMTEVAVAVLRIQAAALI